MRQPSKFPNVPQQEQGAKGEHLHHHQLPAGSRRMIYKGGFPLQADAGPERSKHERIPPGNRNQILQAHNEVSLIAMDHCILGISHILISKMFFNYL